MNQHNASIRLHQAHRTRLFGLLWTALLVGAFITPACADPIAINHADKGFKAQTQNKQEEALQWYARALRLAHRLPRQTLAAVHGARCQLLFARSVTHQSTPLLKHALNDCNQAILLKSDHAIWYGIRSRIHALREEWEQAGEDISLAILLRPDDSMLRLDQARILRHSNQIKTAIQKYTDFLQQSPDHPAALQERGALLLASKEPKRALEDLTRARVLQPWNGETLRLRAETLVALNQLPEALTDLDMAVEVDPQNPESYLHRGSLRASQHAFSEAAKDFQQAVNLRPNDPSLLANLGLIQFLLADFHAAEKIFHHSSTVQPEDPYAPLWRHIARRRAGEQDPVPTPPASIKQEWPRPLFSLFENKTTPEETFNLANRLSDTQLRSLATGETLFFIAQYHLLKDERQAAQKWLERMLSPDHAGEVVMRLIAEEELKRLTETAGKANKQ